MARNPYVSKRKRNAAIATRSHKAAEREEKQNPTSGSGHGGGGNPYHVKAGSSAGGQFTHAQGGGYGKPGQPKDQASVPDKRQKGSWGGSMSMTKGKDRATVLNNRAKKNLPGFKKRYDAVNADAVMKKFGISIGDTVKTYDPELGMEKGVVEGVDKEGNVLIRYKNAWKNPTPVEPEYIQKNYGKLEDKAVAKSADTAGTAARKAAGLPSETAIIPSDWHTNRNGQTANIVVTKDGKDEFYSIAYTDDKTDITKWDSEVFDLADGVAAKAKARKRVGTLSFKQKRQKRLRGAGIDYSVQD
jgi:hypothetical protein